MMDFRLDDDVFGGGQVILLSGRVSLQQVALDPTTGERALCMEIEDLAFFQLHAVNDVRVLSGPFGLAQEGHTLNRQFRKSVVQSMGTGPMSG